MFSSIGLFRNVSCPKVSECNLINCIFSHEVKDNQIHLRTNDDPCDPSSLGENVSPPAKRRRVSSPVSEPANDGKLSNNGELAAESPFIQSSKLQKHVQKASRQAQLQKPVYQPQLKSDDVLSKNETTRTISQGIPRPISPPPMVRKSNQLSKDKVPSASSKHESLAPRQVGKPPAQFKTRAAALGLLHRSMNALNEQLKATNIKEENLELSPAELVRLAVEEEEEMALTCAENIYQQSMGRRIRAVQKMTIDEWKNLVLQKYRKELLQKSDIPAPSENQTIDTGISIEEEIAMLQRLRTPLTGLEAYGYVTHPPTKLAITAARQGVKDSAGWELCDRCGTRFRVMPGRDEKGRLTTNGTCSYHWSKVARPQRRRIDSIVGQQDSYFPCCGQQLGSEGCTTCETHVFKVQDPNRLAAILQFEYTPDTTTSTRPISPITFDCEMAYTTFGMELVRLTAVSWPQGKEVLDVLVRPFGEILDLNTRFSGVSKEQYANATPYDQEKTHQDEDMSEDGEIEPEPLRKVASPAIARDLLFQFLTPDTPLIGHAIENDLNVCRIIHPFVIDTVLLYPHPRGLPIRYGLKMLATKYLNRTIQQGGEQGHDSKEDAIATGELVRVKVKEMWRSLKRNGWEFQNGLLVPPDQVAARAASKG